MRRDLFDRGGFDSPLPFDERRCQRTALSLITSIALAVSTVIAGTVVSVGIAQAQILVATQKADGNFAIACLIACLVVGAVVGEVYRRRQQRPD